MTFKFAAIFSGQGSQHPGMASGVCSTELGSELFERANNALGFDLKQLCLDGSAEDLKLTANAQPAIYAVSYALYKLFEAETGARPSIGAGHSLGEYSALAAAGVFSFEDGLKAVRRRGELMQSSVPVGKGAMAAILGADDADLAGACGDISKNKENIVVPANFNCHGQTVVSGHKPAVEEILTRFKGKLLEVSAPFHSPLMAPAAEAMIDVLDGIQFNDAAFPIVSNIDNAARVKASDFKDSLIAQITGAVLWDSGVRRIVETGVDTFVEFGPGKVLTGLMRRIDKNLKSFNFSSVDELKSILPNFQ